MYCTKCGKEFSNTNQSFCIKCGNKINIITNQPTANTVVNKILPPQESLQPIVSIAKPAKKKNTLIIIAIAFILITSSVAGVFVYNFLVNNKNVQNSSVNNLGIKNGNSPENLKNGGLFASFDNWVFYSNLELDGALCAIKDGEDAPIQLTDFPVANINITEDDIVFTDIYGSFYVEHSANIDTYSFPQGDETLISLLSEKANKDIVFGGNIYTITGVKDLIKNNDYDKMDIIEIDTNGSPAYNVCVIDGELKYSYFSVSSKKNDALQCSTDGSISTDALILLSSGEDRTKSLIEENTNVDGEDTTKASGKGIWNDFENSLTDSNNISKNKWFGRYDVLEKTSSTNEVSMLIAKQVKDSNSKTGYKSEKPITIEGSEGWKYYPVNGLPQINGITYVQVYKEGKTNAGYEVTEMQVWAIDKNTGKKLNSYKTDIFSKMVAKDDSIYFTDNDGFVNEIKDGEKAEKITSNPVSDFKILDDGDMYYSDKGGFIYEIKKGKESNAISPMAVESYDILDNGDILFKYKNDNGKYFDGLLSKESYDKDTDFSNDGVIEPIENGWITYTDVSKFNGDIPILSYINNTDTTKMELFRYKNDIYKWYKIGKDGKPIPMDNMAVPPKFQLKNKHLQDTDFSEDNNDNSDYDNSNDDDIWGLDGDSDSKVDSSSEEDLSSKDSEIIADDDMSGTWSEVNYNPDRNSSKGWTVKFTRFSDKEAKKLIDNGFKEAFSSQKSEDELYNQPIYKVELTTEDGEKSYFCYYFYMHPMTKDGDVNTSSYITGCGICDDGRLCLSVNGRFSYYIKK